MNGLKRKGSFILILLGFLSVMILLLFGVSQRKSRHVRLFTLIDQKQVARFFLESYIEDVLFQLKGQVNSTKSDLFKLIRDSKDETISVAPMGNFFKPCDLLVKLGKENDIKFLGDPEVKISDFKPLEYPSIIEMPKEQVEKSGVLKIAVNITYEKRNYSLSVAFPIKLVLPLTPVLREFVLFFDQLHLEQTQPFGDKDKINILYTKRSDNPTKANNPLKLDIPSEYEKFCGKPLVLFSDDGLEQNKDKNGRVFLGGDSKEIFINLAGEMHFRGWNPDTGESDGNLGDLWTVSPQSFPVNSAKKPFSGCPWNDRSDNLGAVILRALQMKNPKDDTLRMCIVGFSAEIDDKTRGIFRFPGTNIELFVGNDPSFKELAKERKSLALASGLKVYGESGEEEGKEGPPIPAREIFGNAFSRFFLFSTWLPGSAFKEMSYEPSAVNNKGYKPPPKVFFKNSYVWEPASPGDSYSDYMSNVVSGGDPSANKEFKVPLNQEGGKPKVFSYKEFRPADGLKMTGEFEKFAGEWFGKEAAKDEARKKKSVFSRVCKFFPDEKLFKTFVGLDQKPAKLLLDGVYYVKGPLTLPDFTGKEVKGGIVLVDGPISLGKITRGVENLASDAEKEAHSKLVTDLKPTDLVTFVSLTGETISLTGDFHLGVHFVSLKPGLSQPETQIKWVDGKKVIFLGGIAVSTPKLEERVKEFGKIPLISYLPAMADPKPDKLAFIPSKKMDYQLSVEQKN